MTDRPRVTYHLWQEIRGRGGLFRMTEANYSGYRPMPFDAIKIERGRKVIYFPEAAGKKKNVIVAAEKKVGGKTQEFEYLNNGPCEVSRFIQPRLVLLGKEGALK